MLQIVFQMLFNNLFSNFANYDMIKTIANAYSTTLKRYTYYENYLYFIVLNQRFIIIITV